MKLENGNGKPIAGDAAAQQTLTCLNEGHANASTSSSPKTDVTTTSSVPVMTHIYILYTLVAVLTGALVATAWLASCSIEHLHRQLNTKLSVDDWSELCSQRMRMHMGSDV
nr:hypothetical protein BaRGS_013634 [Batillaria attramentaria]